VEKRGAGPAAAFGAVPVGAEVTAARLKEMLSFPKEWGPSEWGARRGAAGWAGECTFGPHVGRIVGPAVLAGLRLAPAAGQHRPDARLPPGRRSSRPRLPLRTPPCRPPGPIPFLPDSDILVRRMEAQWGALEKYTGLNTTAARNLLVTGLQLGNVFVGVQPALGVEGDPMRLLFDRRAAGARRRAARQRSCPRARAAVGRRRAGRSKQAPPALRALPSAVARAAWTSALTRGRVISPLRPPAPASAPWPHQGPDPSPPVRGLL
jgi:hypothetical protein